MIRAALIAGAAALAMASAQAQSVECVPASPLKITGTSNPGGKWAAWMCGKRVQIVACATDHCTDAMLNAGWWVWDRGFSLGDANAALKKYNATSHCDPAVRAVWWPDRYKLRDRFGLTDQQVAAICPAP